MKNMYGIDVEKQRIEVGEKYDFSIRLLSLAETPGDFPPKEQQVQIVIYDGYKSINRIAAETLPELLFKMAKLIGDNFSEYEIPEDVKELAKKQKEKDLILTSNNNG